MKKIIKLICSVFCGFSLISSAQQTNQPQVNVVGWGTDSMGNPVTVPSSITNAVEIAAADNFCLALNADGTVVQWGSVGNLVPAGLSNVVAIAAGGGYDGNVNRSLAVKSDGTVVEWGSRFYYPMPAGLSNVLAVGVINQGMGGLALKTDGTVVGWGEGTPSAITNIARIFGTDQGWFATMRDGTIASGSFSPPSGLSNVLSYSANESCGIALQSDGTVIDFGTYQPQPPVGLSNVIQVAAAGGTFVALKSDGSVISWAGVSVPTNLPYTIAISAAGSAASVFMALVNTNLASSIPVINFEPQDKTVAAGSVTFFEVLAAGYHPVFTYQWYFNGTNAIQGATNSVLTLTNVQIQQSGQYSVVVGNSVGTTTSQQASLSVLPALSINLVPAISLFGGLGITFRIDYINAIGPTNAWNPLATVTLTSSPQFYSDYSAIGQPARFYRSVQLP